MYNFFYIFVFVFVSNHDFYKIIKMNRIVNLANFVNLVKIVVQTKNHCLIIFITLLFIFKKYIPAGRCEMLISISGDDGDGIESRG